MAKSERLEAIIGRLVAAYDPDDIQSAYADWADSYEQDLDFYGYLAPQTGTELFHAALPNLSATVLDAGCGTGWVGKLLAQKGYATVDGCDFSAEMRAKAEQTGHYRALYYADFFHPLPQFADNSYDGITCIGVYSARFGHHFIRELIRIIRPNGIIVFTSRPVYFADNVLPQITQHEANGLIKIESITHKMYMAGQDADAAYIVLRKLD